MNKIKAVIFDLDGTLIDSEPNYLAADQKLFAEYGFMDYTMEMHSKYIGFGSKEMMEDMQQKYPINESVEKLLAKKNRYYIEIARRHTVVYPEMLDFLKLLSSQGYPLALASGSSPEVIRTILSITNLAGYFKIVLSAEDVKCGKPEPDIFIETAKQLGVAVENCLVIEDSQYGVEAAKRAAMYCIALPAPTIIPLHDYFGKADLLFKNGIAEFSAAKSMAWLTGIK
jgi:HAD superfamily hydrolase (TIGR01509 family)